MPVLQKIRTYDSGQSAYSNFWRYGLDIKRWLNDGWTIKHIHDNRAEQFVTVIIEKETECPDKH